MLVHKVVNKKNLIVVGIVLTAGMTSAGAWAQSRRPAKSATVGDLLKNIEKKAKSVDIKKNQSALPEFKSFKQRTAPKNVNLGKIKPPSSSQLYYSEDSDEAKLEKITDDSIKQLYTLTRRFKNSSKRGELWLRLAELYVEKARLIEFRIQNDFDKKLIEFQAGKTKAKPRLNLKPSQEYNLKAIQLYEWFLRDFPSDPKAAQAYFFLGYNYFQIGQEKKGHYFYTQLTKKFPTSVYVDESHFALGEFYFENEKWKDALRRYLRVAKNPKGRLYTFAMYKAGWCFYKLGHVKKAMQSLERVILVGRRSKGEGDKSLSGVSRIRLANEGIKDLVVFYAEIGSPQQAKPYFMKLAGNKTGYSLLEKLAYYYVDRGNSKGAHYIFGQLIRDNPYAPKAYDYQYQIVNLYSYGGDSKAFRQEMYKWIESYGPNSPWLRANAKNKELVAKAQELIETTLRNYVLQLHQTAQASRAKYSQQAARSGYELYLSSFDNSAQASEMRFFYGELLFDMNEYFPAAKQYMWVVQNDPKSKYYPKAALNAILALEKQLPAPEEIKKIVGDSLEPFDYDNNVRNFEKTALNYFEKFPQGENIVAIRYRLASLYYFYNHFDKALALFNHIVKEHPKTKEAEYSANLILDIYNLKKDYAGLEKAADSLLAQPGMVNSALSSQIKDIKEKTAFKKAETYEKNKDYLKSAEAYASFAKAYPKSPLAVGALYNSAVNYERAGSLLSALSAYTAVSQSGGKSHQDIKKKSQKFAATIYEKTGQYEKAASAFESYAKQNPKDSAAINYYYNAAVIYDGMNYYTSALRNYESYYQKTSDSGKEEALFLMAKIWERRRNLSRAQSYYEKYMAQNPASAEGVMEASYKVATISEHRGQRSKAKQWYEKTVAIYDNLKKQGQTTGVRYAAESKFQLVYNSTYKELRGVKIPRNPGAQQKAVERKLSLIDRLGSQLKDVIAYDDGFQVVAALAVQGQAFQHLAASIYGAPVPKGLSSEELDAYKKGIDQLAGPWQEKAIEHYKKAIERGISLQAYNDWLLLAMKELNKLDSNLYPDHGEEVFVTKVPDYMGIGE